VNFHAFNPATGETIEPAFAAARSEDVDRAARAAADAFRHFSRSSGTERARLLRRIADGLEENAAALTEIAMRETALPAARLENERGRTCRQLRVFADVAEHDTWIDARFDAADPQRQPPRPALRSRLRPIGPIVIFGASNFPLAFSVPGGDTAAALAVGCPVIHKAHPAHPGTAALVARVIDDSVRDCGLPAGVFSMLFDSGHAIATALVQHPLIKGAAFTGSRAGGLALWRVAQARPQPIPFFAEMSSVNPVFIFPGMANAALATRMQASMTLGVGQFCTQPGLLFLIDSPETTSFIGMLARLVESSPPGIMLTQSIGAHYAEAIAARGAIAGVTRASAAHETADAHKARAALFTTEAATFLRTAALQEEIFGPTTLVVRCSDTSDFVRCATALEGQLTATVWMQPGERDAQADLLWTLEQRAGRIVFNDVPTGVEVGSATVHGGPFPATTDSRFTSVGTGALLRFVRPVAWQYPAEEPAPDRISGT
jgi:2,5-dioxopentanoate dehydrogenase